MTHENRKKKFIQTDSQQKRLSDNLSMDWPDAVILFCAVLIASVGIGENNLPIIIGSMLISPLIDPLLAIGYGAVFKKGSLFKQGCLLLGLQVFVAIVAAALYFFIVPEAKVNQAILNRTSLSMGIVIVAFFGGIAAIIGSAKKDSGNILPGVAIATSLMPPLATIGFGITKLSWSIISGAVTLF